MANQLEEINRHIEELAGRLPVGNRDRLLEDAMAIRAILVGSESKHHSELSSAYGMAIRKQAEIERLAARLAEEVENAATYKQERDEIAVNYETVAAQLTEAHRQNSDLMAVIDKRDEALGFIPLDKSMDMQDELREAKEKFVKVWEQLAATVETMDSAVVIVRDLTRQITEFCEREGEADFYTGVAVEFLKKQTPCNHVWAKRLRGKDTCAICGVARPADSASLTPTDSTTAKGG